MPQHIKRIIHNEELEIASTRDELEQEISYLREEVVELEEQKSECEQEIGVRSQELAEKKEELAGLDVQSKALMVNRSEPLSAEEIPDDSNAESLNISTIEDIAGLEQLIEEKSQALAEKTEELAGLEVELQGPTEIELNPHAVETISDDTSSAKHRVSRLSLITAIISTIFFIFLAIYLFIFYASAVDKAFFVIPPTT